MDAAVKALSKIQVDSILASESLVKDSLLQDSPYASVVYKQGNPCRPSNGKIDSYLEHSHEKVEIRQDVYAFDDDEEKDVKFNFDTIKSRLRPRNPVDYLKVNIVKQSNEPQHLHSPSPNRKRKEVAFLLNDGGKRRRRYSEHALCFPNHVPRDEMTPSHSNRRLRERSKTEG